MFICIYMYKVNLILRFDFKFEPIFSTSQQPQKALLTSKMVKSDQKN